MERKNHKKKIVYLKSEQIKKAQPELVIPLKDKKRARELSPMLNPVVDLQRCLDENWMFEYKGKKFKILTLTEDKMNEKSIQRIHVVLVP